MADKMEEDTMLDEGEIIELEEVQDLEQETQIVYIVDSQLGQAVGQVSPVSY